MAIARRLPRSFYRRDPRVVAPELLGKVLVADGVAGRIGLSAGTDLPWRWCVPSDPHLSRPA